jgi:hypothetical protein
MEQHFETTIEDIIIAAAQLDVIITEEIAKSLLEELDTKMIESEALNADSFYDDDEDENDDFQYQVDAAIDEIKSQLEESQYFQSLKK